MELTELNQYLGNIDIYLLDQILKKRFGPHMKVLDAGCGEGRNSIYFLNAGYEVHAIDNNPEAVRILRFIAASKRPDLNKEFFRTGDLASLPYNDLEFDLIIASAVLHFADNQGHFKTMFKELIRCLNQNGVLFLRMASNIGLEHQVTPLGEGRYALPDGTTRYLLTRELWEQLQKEFSLVMLEPLKTVNVQDLRCMSTLVISRS